MAGCGCGVYGSFPFCCMRGSLLIIPPPPPPKPLNQITRAQNVLSHLCNQIDLVEKYPLSFFIFFPRQFARAVFFQ